MISTGPAPTLVTPLADDDLAVGREFPWDERFPEPVAMVTHGGVAGGVGGPSVPAGESVYHTLHDALGSVVALTNASGRVVERYTYDPYGRTVVEQANLVTGVPTGRLDASAYGNPFAWTGQRYDPGVKLYHFLFRSYSPGLGRWLQRDPLLYMDGVNLRQYVRSSPMAQTDPLGLVPPEGVNWPPPETPEPRVIKGSETRIGPRSLRVTEVGNAVIRDYSPSRLLVA